jgi:hypothetical protein
MKYQTDQEISQNLEKIIKSDPTILRPDREVNVSRDKLCEDIAALIARLPLNEKQGRVLYNAISGRFKNLTCYKCLKVKSVLSGSYVYPNGDMTKPKRFICGDCS